MFRNLQSDGLLEIGNIIKTYSYITKTYYWYIVLTDNTILCITDQNICNIDGLDENCPQIEEYICKIIKPKKPTIDTRVHIDDAIDGDLIWGF